MYEIRFHGRGGQGAVTAAELLAKAIINEGRYAQAFPSFGTERRGAPVMAFARVSDDPIVIRSEIYEPDVVVVLDSTIPTVVNVKQGLKKGGLFVLNSSKLPEEVEKELLLEGKCKIATVNATKIALDTIGRPITNTAILGAISKATGWVNMDSLVKVVQERFSEAVSIRNINAMKRAYDEVNIR